MVKYDPAARSLAGKVALVTGASRGIGRGIAVALGEAGATVYVTGRTIEEGQSPRPGTIAETAARVTAAGGRGVALACDHRDDAQVDAVFKRILDEQPGLDILINNAFSISSEPQTRPFWELSIDAWDHMHDVGLRAHYVASVFAARDMVKRKAGGFILNVSSFGAVRYHFNVPYHAGKAGLDKMSADMAYELRPHGVAVIAFWPGVVLTDAVLSYANESDRRKGETPLFVGRCVAALAADPATIHKSGGQWATFELGRDFGIEDPVTPEMLLTD